MSLLIKSRDGDGDGFIHDGTPRQRPVISAPTFSALNRRTNFGFTPDEVQSSHDTEVSSADDRLDLKVSDVFTQFLDRERRSIKITAVLREDLEAEVTSSRLSGGLPIGSIYTKHKAGYDAGRITALVTEVDGREVIKIGDLLVRETFQKQGLATEMFQKLARISAKLDIPLVHSAMLTPDGKRFVRSLPPGATERITPDMTTTTFVKSAPILKARDGDGDGFVDDGKPTMRPVTPKIRGPRGVVGGKKKRKKANREAAIRRAKEARGNNFHTPRVVGNANDLRRVREGDVVGRSTLSSREAKLLREVREAFGAENSKKMQAALKIRFDRIGYAHVSAEDRQKILIELANHDLNARGTAYKQTTIRGVARSLGHERDTNFELPDRLVGGERPINSDPTFNQASRRIQKAQELIAKKKGRRGSSVRGRIGALLRAASAFDESLHRRDAKGRFAEKGGNQKKLTPEAKHKLATEILPDGINIPPPPSSGKPPAPENPSASNNRSERLQRASEAVQNFSARVNAPLDRDGNPITPKDKKKRALEGARQARNRNNPAPDVERPKAEKPKKAPKKKVDPPPPPPSEPVERQEFTQAPARRSSLNPSSDNPNHLPLEEKLKLDLKDLSDDEWDAHVEKWSELQTAANIDPDRINSQTTALNEHLRNGGDLFDHPPEVNLWEAIAYGNDDRFESIEGVNVLSSSLPGDPNGSMNGVVIIEHNGKRHIVKSAYSNSAPPDEFEEGTDNPIHLGNMAGINAAYNEKWAADLHGILSDDGVPEVRLSGRHTHQDLNHSVEHVEDFLERQGIEIKKGSAKDGKKWSKTGAPKVANREKMVDTIIMDYLTNNTDRHGANYMTVEDKDGNQHFVPIDNGMAFYDGAHKQVKGVKHGNATNPYTGEKFGKPDHAPDAFHADDIHDFWASMGPSEFFARTTKWNKGRKEPRDNGTTLFDFLHKNYEGDGKALRDRIDEIKENLDRNYDKYLDAFVSENATSKLHGDDLHNVAGSSNMFLDRLEALVDMDTDEIIKVMGLGNV